MKQYFLKASAIAALGLMVHASGISQDTPPPPQPPPPQAVAPIPPNENPDRAKGNEEIIIRKRNDKDIKVTVEVKDGQVFINGKPAEEFSDDNITVQKRIFRSHEGDGFSVLSPDMDLRVSPFRGGWSYNGDDNVMKLSGSNAAFLGVSSENTDGKGAKIKGVTEGSAAEKAGLRTGDIITKINDAKVNGPEQLTAAIHKFKPEDKITVTYSREGKEQKVTTTLGKNKMLNLEKTYNFSMPKVEKLKELSEMDGMNAPYSFSWSNDKHRLGIKAQDTEDGKGVKVLDVDEESTADKAGVKEGDIITEFDGKPVNSAETLANLARENREKSSYKIHLNRDGKSQEVEIKIPKKLKTADL
jgi:serine protease Do